MYLQRVPRTECRVSATSRTTALLQPNCVSDTPSNGVEVHSRTPSLGHASNNGVEVHSRTPLRPSNHGVDATAERRASLIDGTSSRTRQHHHVIERELREIFRDGGTEHHALLRVDVRMQFARAIAIRRQARLDDGFDA